MRDPTSVIAMNLDEAEGIFYWSEKSLRNSRAQITEMLHMSENCEKYLKILLIQWHKTHCKRMSDTNYVKLVYHSFIE